MHKYSKDNLGEFQEKTFGKYFTYTACTDPWAMSLGYKHEIHVLDGTRFANVLKTRVKVLVDEGQEETWEIKKHLVYKAG